MARECQFVYLIPAGSTRWSEEGRIQGTANLPLSAAGEAASSVQAAQWNPPLSPAVIYHPEDEASTQTAAIFADRFQARAKSTPGLHEVKMGLWEGLTLAELAERYAKAYTQWIANPALVDVPEGENVEDALLRIAACIGKSLKKANQPVAFVLPTIAFNIAELYVLGQSLADWSSPDQERNISTIELDADMVRSICATRRRKTVKPAPRRKSA